MQPTAWEPEGVEALLDSTGALADPTVVDGLDLRGYYKQLVAARILDVKLGRLELPMWASAAGEESVAVALAQLLRESEWVFTGNRDAAIAMLRGVPLTELLAQLLGLPGASTSGRNLAGTIHAPSHKVVGPSDALGVHLGVATGHAHGQRLRGESHATAIVFGEGLTTTGMFHESVSLALTHDIPLVFVCKSRVWPEGAPAEAGVLGDSIGERAQAIGLWSRRCDGADAIGVRRSLDSALRRAREGGGPALVEVIVTPLAHDPPAERDPVERLRRLLDARGEWTATFQDVTEAEVHGRLDKALVEINP